MQYMDRTFVKSFNKTPVYTHGMDIWRDEIVHYQDVGGRLLEIFLEQVAAERSGDIVDRSTLAEVTKMMLELGKPVYIQDLQEPFLAKSKEFFLCVFPPPFTGAKAPVSVSVQHVPPWCTRTCDCN
jgi:cullin 3